MFKVAVMYPSGGTFDLDYYFKTHMKLVDDKWRPHGLRHWEVLKGAGSPAGEGTYQITTTLDWDNPAAFQAAVTADGREIMGDIPNFTDRQPVMQFYEPVTG